MNYVKQIFISTDETQEISHVTQKSIYSNTKLVLNKHLIPRKSVRTKNLAFGEPMNLYVSI